jgi:hypothetical protein
MMAAAAATGTPVGTAPPVEELGAGDTDEAGAVLDAGIEDEGLVEVGVTEGVVAAVVVTEVLMLVVLDTDTEVWEAEPVELPLADAEPLLEEALRQSVEPPAATVKGAEFWLVPV